jgi:DNA primase
MPRVSSETVACLKRSTDLKALVESYGIKLEAQGADFVALCPFHEETAPSFHVTPAKNLFHCFGCGAAGSVLDFLMRKERLTFRQAVDLLLNKTGGVVQRASALPGAPEKKAVVIAPERVQQLLERVLEIYHQNFLTHPEGRNYMERRGIKNADLWAAHRIGYSDDQLKRILPHDETVLAELTAAGLLNPEGREHFANCVVFPVRDAEGGLITIYGRYLKGGKKRHVFLADRPRGLWNAAAVKTCSQVILVESVLDALSLAQAGHANALGIMGTTGLNEADVNTLRDYGVQKVTLLMDGDLAGRGATARLKSLLTAFQYETRDLPDGHDPNSYLMAFGPEQLAGLLAKSPEPEKPDAPQNVSDGFAVTFGPRRYEVRGLEKTPRKLRATVRVECAGKLHVDTLDFYAARARKQLQFDLARALNEACEVIESDIAKLIVLCEQQPERATASLTANPAETMTAEARAEAEAFGKNPELIKHIMADYEQCGLVGERANKLLCYLAMTSRKLDKPLSLLILSSSGAGKTMLQDTALHFCPPEDLVKLTSLSGKALFYKEQTSLKHKVLALEEGEGMAEATYAIRNLVSAGELVIEATIKDPVSGKLKTMANRVDGPTAVFITTTDPETDAETKSRFFVTSIDESREQTQAILEWQRRRQTLAGLSVTLEQTPLWERHRNFQRLLRPLAVVNPYADQLRYGDDRLQSRRDQPKYLSLIKAVAFLRQMQKPVKTWNGNGQACAYLEADREDIRQANELANELIGHSLDELSRPGHNLLQLLEKMPQSGTAPEDDEAAKRKNRRAFTRRDIREFTGWSQARVHRYLSELVELEYVVLESGRNGTLQTYRLLYRGEGRDGCKFVLGLRPVEELRPPTP